MFRAGNSSRRPCDPAADQTQPTLRLLPDGQRRAQQRRVDASLVYSGDFHCEPTLKFAQRENRAFFGRVAFSSFRIAESCARKDVNRSHHGADQPLNVTAEAGRRRRTVDELDPVLAAGGFQCSGVKFRAVVAMQDGRQARDRPWMFNAALLQPRGLVVNRVQEAEAHRRAAGRIERQVKACDHSCADIDRERQKGATDRQSCFFIDDDQIDDRMIDLPNVVRPFRVEAAGARGHLAPSSRSSQKIEFVNAALDGAAMRRREPLDSTRFMHPLDQGAHFRLLFFQPEAVDLLADEVFGSDIQALSAVGGAAASWDQT